MENKLTFLLVFFLNFLFEVVTSSQILEVPLIYQPQNVERRYCFYFTEYSKPIALSFSHSNSYLGKSFFEEFYNSINDYPSPQGNSNFLAGYKLFSEKLSFKGPNSNISFIYKFYANTNSFKYVESSISNFLTLRYSKEQREQHIAIYLYQQNIIPYPKFSLFLEGKKLFLGGIHKSIEAEKLYEQKVIISKVNRAGLILNVTSFEMGKINFDFHKEPYLVLISLERETISVPAKILDEIVEIHFKEYILNNKCIKEEDDSWEIETDRDYWIWCDKEIITELPDVSIGFGNVKFKIKNTDAFKCVENNNNNSKTNCLFQFVLGQSNIYQLGTSFWKKYLMEFNLENDNETFGFYSLKEDNLTNKKFYFFKIILCNNCLLLFFGMIMTYLSKLFFK